MTEATNTIFSRRPVWLLAMVLCCLWPVTAPAQPAFDESWLSVSVVDADGQPFPAAPTVTLFRTVNNKRMYEGRAILSTGNTTSLIGLTVGKYEAQIILQPFGLIDGPKTIELISGPNIFTWQLPRITPVAGALTPPDPAKATPPKEVMAFAQSVGNGGARQVQCSLAKDGFHLFGVFAGAYRLLVVTDQGYGLTTFTVSADRKEPVDAPIALTAGGIVSFEVKRPQDKEKTIPVAGVTVTLSCPVERGFAPSIVLRTDREGKASTASLPPGTWSWTAVSPNLPQASGKITVTAGETQTVAVTLGGQ
ncbi:MAG: carboxypeptidase-like regulatory domain-containing protein [Armatimonadota bacterium]